MIKVSDMDSTDIDVDSLVKSTKVTIFASPLTPSEILVLALLDGVGWGLKGAFRISGRCLQINRLDICIIKGCFIFSVLKKYHLTTSSQPTEPMHWTLNCAIQGWVPGNLHCMIKI